MLSKEELAELETKHQRIAHVVGPLLPEPEAAADAAPPDAPKEERRAWEVVYRKPKRAEYKRFRAMLFSDTQKSDATEMFARVLVVYPSSAAFDALLEDYPGICEASGPKLTALAGMSADDAGKV